MDREEAILLGLNMMSSEFGIDASSAIPKFVHILFDSNDGTIDDRDIYDGPECDACKEEEDVAELYEDTLDIRIGQIAGILEDVSSSLLTIAGYERAKKASDNTKATTASRPKTTMKSSSSERVGTIYYAGDDSYENKGRGRYTHVVEAESIDGDIVFIEPVLIRDEEGVLRIEYREQKRRDG